MSIEIPTFAPPGEGPWKIRWTRPNGETGVTLRTWDDRGEAEHLAKLCRRCCREGCTYDVVPAGGE